MHTHCVWKQTRTPGLCVHTEAHTTDPTASALGPLSSAAVTFVNTSGVTETAEALLRSERRQLRVSARVCAPLDTHGQAKSTTLCFVLADWIKRLKRDRVLACPQFLPPTQQTGTAPLGQIQESIYTL